MAGRSTTSADNNNDAPSTSSLKSLERKCMNAIMLEGKNLQELRKQLEEVQDYVQSLGSG